MKGTAEVKNRKKIDRRQEGRSAKQQGLVLTEFVRQSLHDFVVFEGMKALHAMLEEDREKLCGAAYCKRIDGAPVRWGKAEGRLAMGGQRVTVTKPRVRQQGREVALPTWEAFADDDALTQRSFDEAVIGVSTRNYARSVEPLPPEVNPHGASKSATSRRFVAKTQEYVEQWLKRDLSQLALAVIMIDGIVIDDDVVLIALGIDEGGNKHPLGVWHGATENTAAVQSLLADLVSRGVYPLKRHLFVIDGAKALRKAIFTVFGKSALVQRCQEHKRRNVIEHLPEQRRKYVNSVLQQAYRMKSKELAKRRLLQLVNHLKADYPDAAASLQEGLEETLTVKSMDLLAALERTLATTNPIENMNGTIRRVTRNVKRWRDGSMIKRWVAGALIEAQTGFRKLRGYKGMPKLVAYLRKTPSSRITLDAQEQAA